MAFPFWCFTSLVAVFILNKTTWESGKPLVVPFRQCHLDLLISLKTLTKNYLHFFGIHQLCQEHVWNVGPTTSITRVVQLNSRLQEKRSGNSRLKYDELLVSTKKDIFQKTQPKFVRAFGVLEYFIHETSPISWHFFSRLHLVSVGQRSQIRDHEKLPILAVSNLIF